MTLRTKEILCRLVRLQPRIGKFGTRIFWVIISEL